MAWNLKLTTISGYDTTERLPPPVRPMAGPDAMARIAWCERHHVVTSRRGYLRDATALKIARSKGIVGPVEVQYSSIDMNGRGGSYIARRATIDESGSRELPVSAREQDEYAESSDRDIADQMMDE